MQKIIKYTWAPTTSGGSSSQNLTSFHQIVEGLLLRHIFIKSRTSGIIFDFAIISPDSNAIFHREEITRELIEISEIPLDGIYTLTISNCSQDDTFDCEFGFEERG